MKHGTVQKKNAIRKSMTAGFTLVEMIVSIFMFTVVMLIAVGALVSVIDANSKAQANKSVLNNLHFALESMTREIRTGTQYSSSGGAGGSSDFSFTDKDGCIISYHLESISEGENEIWRSVDNTNDTCAKNAQVDVPLTASEVNINTLMFYVYGTGANDGQPHVFILMRGVAGEKEKTKVAFNLETMVTQRFLDR